MDKQKHKLYMAQILTMVFKDKELCIFLCSDNQLDKVK